MRIAIVGGSGFIGRALTKRLHRAGHEGVIFSRHKPALEAELGERFSWRHLDATKTIEPKLLEGFDAAVNLVGIKLASSSQSFEDAHVLAVERLLRAASDAELPHFVHVSVAGAGGHRSKEAPSSNPYRRSKATGEALVETWAGDWTVLRPAVVYGVGDDMLAKLVPLIVQSPVFPAPRGGQACVQAVHVEDLCETIVRCVEHRDACRKLRFDVVPEERTSLEELVSRVSTALGLRTRCVAMPGLPQRIAAAAMERVMKDPLITRSQLDLLGRGISGSARELEQALNFVPRNASMEVFRDLLETNPIPAADGWSLRLDGGPAARERRAEVERAVPMLALTIFVLLVVHTVAALALRHPWIRVGVLDLLVLVGGLGLAQWPLRTLFRAPRPASALGVGLALAALMWGCGAGVHELLVTRSAEYASGVATILAWHNLAPLALTLALIVLTVCCEELAWRGAVAIPLAHRWGPWTGWLIATLLYALAHLFVGPPVLVLAALGAGALWTWMAISRGGLLAAVVCHLFWDLLVFWLAPYS